MRHEIWQCLDTNLHFDSSGDGVWTWTTCCLSNIAIASAGLIPNGTNWFIIAAYSLPTFWGRIHLFYPYLTLIKDSPFKTIILSTNCCSVWYTQRKNVKLQVKGQCNGSSFSSAVSPAWRHMPAYDISISLRCFLLILKHSCQAPIVNNTRQL